jgi:hypothetical protein
MGDRQHGGGGGRGGGRGGFRGRGGGGYHNRDSSSLAYAQQSLNPAEERKHKETEERIAAIPDIDKNLFLAYQNGKGHLENYAPRRSSSLIVNLAPWESNPVL